MKTTILICTAATAGLLLAPRSAAETPSPVPLPAGQKTTAAKKDAAERQLSPRAQALLKSLDARLARPLRLAEANPPRFSRRMVFEHEYDIEITGGPTGTRHPFLISRRVPAKYFGKGVKQQDWAPYVKGTIDARTGQIMAYEEGSKKLVAPESHPRLAFALARWKEEQAKRAASTAEES